MKKEKIKRLEVSEYHALVTGMDVEEWKLLTQFLAMTGLRIGELTALKKEDVDLKEKKIHVRKSYDAAHRCVTRIKTESSIRDVHMQPELVDLVKEINLFFLKRSLANGIHSDLFFPGSDGDYLHYDEYNKYLKERSEKICGKRIMVHMLRETTTLMLLDQGIPVQEVLCRLGC